MRKYLDVTITKPEYYGINRYCNICGYRFAKFGQFGLKPREAQCPVCGSLERHRHLYIYILSIYPFLDGKKILHFAPEPIIKNILSASNAEYYDADIDPKRATHKVDITKISFDDETFDYIFCIHVLEHIHNDILAMKEMYRVLKKHGTAFLCVPLRNIFAEDLSITDPNQRTVLYGQHDHVRNYNIETFLNRLSSVGFDISMVSDYQKFPSELKDAKLGDKIVLAKRV